jgi:hypothetical protein
VYALAVKELSWYFHLGDYECELEFAYRAMPYREDVPDLQLRAVAKHRRIRRRLSELPEGYADVIAAAFECRRYPESGGTYEGIDLAPLVRRLPEGADARGLLIEALAAYAGETEGPSGGEWMGMEAA